MLRRNCESLILYGFVGYGGRQEPGRQTSLIDSILGTRASCRPAHGTLKNALRVCFPFHPHRRLCAKLPSAGSARLPRTRDTGVFVGLGLKSPRCAMLYLCFHTGTGSLRRRCAGLQLPSLRWRTAKPASGSLSKSMRSSECINFRRIRCAP